MHILFNPILIFFLVLCSEIGFSLHVYLPRIHRRIPHQGFTQGLLYHQGYLYESTGLYGQSTIKKIDPHTGEVVKKKKIPLLFAEGLAQDNNKFYQLSWKAGQLNIYDEHLTLIKTKYYFGEGWGLTFGQGVFFMSDGSEYLQIRGKKDFKLKKKIKVQLSDRAFQKLRAFDEVMDAQQPLSYFNELEYVRGKVYANVWYKSYLVIIDIKNGQVTGVVDCRELVNQEKKTMEEKGTWQKDNVLNGIAFDSNSEIFFLTGKNWSYIYLVILDPLTNRKKENKKN